MSDKPATIGDLRRDGLRLHIFCQGCSRQREVRLDRAPFDRLPADVPVAMAGTATKLKCKCGEERQIWTAPEDAEATPEQRLRWGWTKPEIEERARQDENRGTR